MSAYQKFIASASPPAGSHFQDADDDVESGRRRSQYATSAPRVRDAPVSSRMQQHHQSGRAPNENNSQPPSSSCKIEMMRQHYSCLPLATEPKVVVCSSTPLQSARRQLWAPPSAVTLTNHIIASQQTPEPLHPAASQQNFYANTTNQVSQVRIKHQPSIYGSRQPIQQQHQRPAQQQQQHHHHQQPLYSSHQNKQQQVDSNYMNPQSPTQVASRKMMNLLMQTQDPLLHEWIKAMRFETELECLTSLQARTLAIDEHSAGALSVRNSQVNIQEIRAESNFILDFIDCLIESKLPLDEFTGPHALLKLAAEFSELWTRIVNQTASQSNSANRNCNVLAAANQGATYQQNGLTIINCTPRKAPMSAKTLRPLDELVVKIRNLCFAYAKLLDQIQSAEVKLDNGVLESELRRLKELYGKFVEICIRAECANIVRALNYDFSQSSLNRLSSTSSLLPVRPFESSSAQLPLKWALIALWQLTKDDAFICRILTEKWEMAEPEASEHQVATAKVAKRLEYTNDGFAIPRVPMASMNGQSQGKGGSSSSTIGSDIDVESLQSDYQKLFERCQSHHYGNKLQMEQQENQSRQKQQRQQRKSVSTIELLIDVIISQPNKHERLDMMNFVHSQAQHDKLIDLDEWDQSVSAAIYTSNQYKVAALRILNHLCTNEDAVRMILRCFATAPPARGQPLPENKIIRSIFECYQTAQEHIYQNDVMLHPRTSQQQQHNQQQRKRSRQQVANSNHSEESDEYSDYGSRQTNSIPTSGCSHDHETTTTSTLTNRQCHDEAEGGDDVVVKEAVRLLVQLTTVFHASNQAHELYALIGRASIDSLVKYLTNIIKSTGSREMVLLSLSALANISFITTDPMKTFETNRAMLEMFKSSRSRSKDLELRDQAVTILANTAEKNLLDIVNNGGLSFLMSCLESCPTKMANYKSARSSREPPSPLIFDHNLENKPRNRKPIDFSNNAYPDFLDCACDQQVGSPQSRIMFSNGNNFLMPSLCLSKLSRNELAAMERIHQKTAVAFARMSIDPSTTRLVLEFGGVKQLIDLCKLANKRNFSDTVLIACIAALRKMAKVIDNETFKHYNALDLIELDLNKALEIYGNPRDYGQDVVFASDV